MKNLVRKWLGLDNDLSQILDSIAELGSDVYDVRKGIERIEVSSRAVDQGLGRLIAKADPMFGQPDTRPKDPAEAKAYDKRLADSDRLGQQAIDRLQAEDWARRHTLGEV